MTPITISYTLSPPSSIDTSGLRTSKSLAFGIPNSLTSSALPVSGSNPPVDDLKSYYAALRSGLADAKSVVGEELTVWRDRVGKGEFDKEGKDDQSEDGDGDGERAEEEDA